MRQLKLTVAYDGTDLVGWQRQSAGTSVQGLLEEALTRIEGAPVRVAGAGRTDAGVHALAQVASCASTATLDCGTLRRALNAMLPPAVRVLGVEEVDAGFHARFSARGKAYRYVLVEGPVVSPFAARYAWHVPHALDLAAMDAGALRMAGTHDFSGFQSTGSLVPHAVRTVTEATVTDVTPAPGMPMQLAAAAGARVLAFDVAADGFLRHMVRAMAGTLVDIGAGRRDPSSVDGILAQRARAAAGATAPAHGLWLVRVNY